MRRAVSSSGSVRLDLEHSVCNPIAHRGADVRVVVPAGYLVPQALEWLFHNRDSSR
jgi:hypothetical protein